MTKASISLTIKLAIKRSEVNNVNKFVELLDLYGLKIVAEEPQYYIIEGDGTSEQAFLSYWDNFGKNFRTYIGDLLTWKYANFATDCVSNRAMNKTICFYPTNFKPPESNDDFVYIYSEVDDQLNKLKDVVQTSQMCMLHHPNISKYDLIRIINNDDDIIVIRNNHDGTYDCNRTDKELRYAHNLFKMWEAGTFDRDDRQY